MLPAWLHCRWASWWIGACHPGAWSEEPGSVCLCVCFEGFLSKWLLGGTKRPCWRESVWNGHKEKRHLPPQNSAKFPRRRNSEKLPNYPIEEPALCSGRPRPNYNGPCHRDHTCSAISPSPSLHLSPHLESWETPSRDAHVGRSGKCTLALLPLHTGSWPEARAQRGGNAILEKALSFCDYSGGAVLMTEVKIFLTWRDWEAMGLPGCYPRLGLEGLRVNLLGTGERRKSLFGCTLFHVAHSVQGWHR